MNLAISTGAHGQRVSVIVPRMSERPVSGSRLIDWLTLNGLISPSDTLVSRVLIDIKPDSVVKVYVERFGSERMLTVIPPHLEPTQIVEVDRPVNPKCAWCLEPIEIRESGQWGHCLISPPSPRTDGGMRFWCGLRFDKRVEPA